MSHLSDIEEQMNTMKKTMEEIGEKIVLEKEKSIQNFLQALVQCGEISEEKKESIENNVYLVGFFMKDLDESSDSDSSSEEELDKDELGEVEFEGVDYLADIDNSIVYSMTGMKIGTWNEDSADGPLIWDKTSEGEKAKKFHSTQQ